MTAVRMLRSGLLAATLLCLAAASAFGSEEDVAARPENAPAWDQQKATSAAESLATSLDGLRTALRQQPSMTLARGTGSRSIHRLRDRLRLMESESKQLAQQLGEGRGRDETLPIFERINLGKHYGPFRDFVVSVHIALGFDDPEKGVDDLIRSVWGHMGKKRRL